MRPQVGSVGTLCRPAVQLKGGRGGGREGGREEGRMRVRRISSPIFKLEFEVWDGHNYGGFIVRACGGCLLLRQSWEEGWGRMYCFLVVVSTLSKDGEVLKKSKGRATS